MTRISYSEKALSLEIRGHAGAGTRGRDIVCAGVSALSFALAGAARKNPAYRARLRTDWDAGLLTLRCDPADSGAAEKCRCLFAAFADGLRMIAEAYPENAVFIREDDCVQEKE